MNGNGASIRCLLWGTFGAAEGTDYFLLMLVVSAAVILPAVYGAVRLIWVMLRRRAEIGERVDLLTELKRLHLRTREV